jgi:teichuronic acid biosynthesis glycosyltransferase TuaC
MSKTNLRVLFVCSGNHPVFEIAPFVKSQADSLIREGLTVDFFMIRGKGMKGYLSHIAPLRRAIRKENYDIIHAHYSFCGWVARLASFSTPVVVSFMGSDTYGSVDAFGKWRLRSLPVILQGMLLSLLADAVIVKSANLYRWIPAKKRTHIVPNGVDFSYFTPYDPQVAIQQLGLSPAFRYILFLGNPEDPRKNISLVTSAISLISEKAPVRLLTPYPSSPDKVPLFLNAASLLVVTSFLEGSPNVVKEAMACNCPVVATSSGDIAQVISGTDQCFLAEFNAEDLAAKMLRVILSGKRSNGRERIPHLDSRNIALKIYSIYKNITSK